MRGRRSGLAVGAISLGCPKNLVDTEVMLGLLDQAGFAVVADPQQAQEGAEPDSAGLRRVVDVILVSTCCFIAPAREEAAQALSQAVRWKQSGGARAVVCAGCWPQAALAELKECFPEVDAFMGPDQVPQVVSVVQQALAGLRPQPPVRSSPTYLYDDSTPRLRATPPWTAYLKIAEGCSHRCAFCIIPRLRGRYRCRRPSSVVAEAERLAGEGVVEVNLVAQDTTAYRDEEGGADIADLLAALARTDGLRWVRLLYGFPSRVTKRLIGTMAREPVICKYLDLPFQHADRGILHRMGRPGEGTSYLRLIADLRAAMPDIAIRSSFLVGFPGEGEGEFQHLLEFVEAAQLDRVGAFCFSPEPGTPAADMPDQVPAELASERYHRLMSLQQGISLARNQRWVGRDLEVLVERRGQRQGEWVGRSFRDAPEIDGTVVVRPARGLRLPKPRPGVEPASGGPPLGVLNGPSRPSAAGIGRRPSAETGLAAGRLVRVKVTRAGPYDLTGVVSDVRDQG